MEVDRTRVVVEHAEQGEADDDVVVAVNVGEEAGLLREEPAAAEGAEDADGEVVDGRETAPGF